MAVVGGGVEPSTVVVNPNVKMLAFGQATV